MLVNCEVRFAKINLLFFPMPPANDLLKQCMPDYKNLIQEVTELVCDLHSPGTHYIPSQETSFNSLLRPRLPTEVSFNRLRS